MTTPSTISTTIDAHQHFWQYDSVRDTWITNEMEVIRRDFLPQDLKPILEQHGIDGCVAVQADQSVKETEFLLKLAGENEFIKGVVGWIDLKANDIDEKLRDYSAYEKLKGFRHIVQGEPEGFMKDPAFVNGVRRLADFDYTYDLLIYHYQLPEALAFLNEVHHARIVIDHLAKPSIRTGEKTQWELNMAAAATFNNVYCKISGMVTEAKWNEWTKEDFFPYLDEVFEAFGADRLMYGSDWPVSLLSAQYDQQLEIVLEYLDRLSPREKKLVMGENAVRFYNL